MPNALFGLHCAKGVPLRRWAEVFPWGALRPLAFLRCLTVSDWPLPSLAVAVHRALFAFSPPADARAFADAYLDSWSAKSPN